MRWLDMLIPYKLIIAFTLLSYSYLSFSQEISSTKNVIKVERGIYFYEKNVDKKPIVPKKNQSTKENKSPEEKEKECKNQDKWDVNCGFVDPTTLGLSSEKAFEFEQKQYKGLIRNYALYPNNAEAVYNFQKFNMWVLNQAMTASYTWQYNLAQHPEVSANVQVPVSQFGMQLIKNIDQQSEKDFWKTLSKTAFFVLITKTDNPICQSQGTIMHILERETGMTVWNFSIDEKHLPGFDHYMNYPLLKKEKREAIAKHIQMNWLPTVYLYMKPVQANDIGHWIRVTSGITPLDEIKERTINFVEAYRHAIVEGVGDNKKIRPDFSANYLYQLAGKQLKNTEDKGEKK